jgi:FkbM family methyltransferase
MLNKINQYILNRTFDKRLANHLLLNNITLKKHYKHKTIYFPQEVKLRPSPSSDFSVFLQVFYDEQYAPIISLCKWNNIEVNTILDFGANIGLTSIYFNKKYNNAAIYAVEPDDQNFEMLKRNTERINNIYIDKKAIWSHETSLTPSFEEQSDWGKTFKESPLVLADNIEAISINHFLLNKQLEIIDILKIDIEGAEKQVFEGDVSFLKNVKIIAIEIHEEQIKKTFIQNILLNNKFILQEAGELLIGINSLFLAHLSPL